MEEITIEKIKKRVQSHLRTHIHSDNLTVASNEGISFSNHAHLAEDTNGLLKYLFSLKNNDIFLREVYKIILRRSLDDSGHTSYTSLLNMGIPKLLILYQIANSKEAKSKKMSTNITWISVISYIATLLEDKLIDCGLKNKRYIKKY